ncbi:MAG TPA: tetratricopeptide repeat protein, partial [Magnetococcales bacterium]|nr:tetratricopeptide repeat protein [Magnetococcales bacterium]
MTALPGKQWIFPTKTWRKTLSLILWGLLLLLWNPVHAGNDTKGQLANAQAAVRLAVDRYGPHSVETIPARMALAELHIAEGDFPKAEPLLQQALNISLRANGAEHKSQLPILERLAWIDIRNNRFSSGKQFYADAIEIARKVHGTNSPVMQKLIDSLADARQKERVAGTLTNVRRKQTPPSQESTSPAYDLVIASQDQPPPVAALLLPTVPPAGADSKDKSVGHPPTAKDTKAPDSSAVATAPTAPSSAKASPSQEPSIPAAPPSNSPFLFGVSTPQPVTWKADPATGSQPKPQPTTPTTSVTTAPTTATP